MPFDWVNGPFAPIKLVSQWDSCSDIHGFEQCIAGTMAGLCPHPVMPQWHPR